MKDGDVGRLLASVPVPGELEARRRSWHVVRTAFERRERVEPDRRSLRAPALAFAAAAAIFAAAFSSPGRAMLDSVRDAIAEEKVAGYRPAKPALFSLPADGRLLVNSGTGSWIVQPDGSRRRLGAYREATWSPEGRFVAVATRNELAALEPDGDVRWTIARPNLRHPRWGGTRTDTRVAYMSGSSLRLVGGDSRGDRLLVGRVADVAPAWKPGGEHVLAYVTVRGRIRVVDTTSGRVLAGWRAERPKQLLWSADGRFVATRGERVLALHTAQGLERRRLVPDRTSSGRALGSKAAARFADRTYVDMAFAPDGRTLAVVLYDPSVNRSSVRLYGVDGRRRDAEVFAGAGRMTDVEWSPDGRWLLIAWKSADQWLFLRPIGGLSKIVARSSITAQLSRGAVDAPFPTIAGWCCP